MRKGLSRHSLPTQPLLSEENDFSAPISGLDDRHEIRLSSSIGNTVENG
jgi:hypothetical protein